MNNNVPMKNADMSKFAVFILTHGRPHKDSTFNKLRDGGYTGKIIILLDNQDDKYADYVSKYGVDNICVFDKEDVADRVDSLNNFKQRNAILFARQASFEAAKKLGYEYFCQMDDDYYYFGHKRKERGKKTTNLDYVFKCFVEFLINTPTSSIAFSQGGDHIGGYNEDVILKRKCMNSWFCKTNEPFQFFGILNDDVNAYLCNGMRGKLFFTFMPFKLDQDDTQSNRGGITDMYKDEGTYMKSFYSVMLCPSCVKVKQMGWHSLRMHHNIAWKNAVPCIIDEKYKKK